MNTHLDEQHISAAVAGLDLEPGAGEHLASCLSCRQRVAAFKDLIDARGAQMAAEMPDWDRQREEILLQLPTNPVGRPMRTRRWMRPLFAAAAAVLVIVGLELIWSSTPTSDPAVELKVPVEQILAEVDAILADESLPGFESIDPGVEDPQSYFDNGAS